MTLLLLDFIHCFSEPLMDVKSLISEVHNVRVLYFCKYLIILKHCFIKIVDICSCVFLFLQPFINKTSSLYYIFIPNILALWIFSIAKSSFWRSFLPWSIVLLKKKLMPLKVNALITAPPIVNNTDAIYFLATRRKLFWHKMMPQNLTKSTHYFYLVCVYGYYICFYMVLTM